jgi:long-subunit fatty acid transport protein
MWRITYMTQTVDTPLATMRPPAGVLLNQDRTAVSNADISATGLNFKGFQFGLFYRVLPNLRLGLSYRTKVVVEGEGYTVTHLGDTEIKLPTQRGFSNPHAIRAGFAWSVLNDKLLLAADFKYLFYAEAWKTLETTTTQPNGMKMVNSTPAYWYDSWVVQVGGELKTGKVVSLRTGYTILKSATNPAYALSYFAPPGLSHLVTAGMGFKVIDSVNIDVAAGYVVLQSHIDEATDYNAGVGLYASHGAEFSLAASYHM